MKDTWREVRAVGSNLTEKLQCCVEKIQLWNKKNFENVQQKIGTLQKEIRELKEASQTEETSSREEKVAEELDEWFAREELLWKQRARTVWLKGGEHNVVFFRAKASRRKDRKHIESLLNQDWTRINDSEQIMEEFVRYFNFIFSSSNAGGAHTDWIQVMRAIQPQISEEVNIKVTEAYTEEEVRKALFQMIRKKLLESMDSQLYSIKGFGR